jgi:hypothetical protein
MAQESNLLRFSCPSEPYVGISARTPGGEQYPEVDLLLRDDQQRTAGFGAGKSHIPNYKYHGVILPFEPPRREKDLEICDAKQGNYEVEIHEHGNGPYIFTLTGQAANGSHSLLLHPVAQAGRLCLYRFSFTVTADDVEITWVDVQGKNYKIADAVPCVP